MSILETPYQIFSLERKNFLKTALEIFRYQAKNCSIYNQYIEQIGVDIEKVSGLKEIPFLPIQFYKTHKVISTATEQYRLFESSATSSQIPSKHYVTDEELYKRSILQSFQYCFGSISDKIILGLLPHYLERQNSSLVYMVDFLMKQSGQDIDGFYLDKESELIELLLSLKHSNKEIVLFGVTFALLDLAKNFSTDLSHVIIIETGGMKGRAEELTREVVHDKLKRAFNLSFIYSEYGMAELLSQSYYQSNEKFISPGWKQILVRDLYDPFDVQEIGKGALNIIDLANIHSCSFIATDDLGVVHKSQDFNIIGRLDASEIRGCNLLLPT